ncbi:MAG: hypothetical protein H0U48_07005 [Euzebyaceae bacterium]|jgi:hypothetical protein|nr:hypothetical protein [Euzebyaceae bacterium]
MTEPMSTEAPTDLLPVDSWPLDPATDLEGWQRELILAEAVDDGRIAASSVPGWRKHLRDNPDAGAQVLGRLSAPPDALRGA